MKLCDLDGATFRAYRLPLHGTTEIAAGETASFEWVVARTTSVYALTILVAGPWEIAIANDGRKLGTLYPRPDQGETMREGDSPLPQPIDVVAGRAVAFEVKNVGREAARFAMVVRAIEPTGVTLQ